MVPLETSSEPGDRHMGNMKYKGSDAVDWGEILGSSVNDIGANPLHL